MIWNKRKVLFLQVLLFYNDRASFNTLVELMKRQASHEALLEHVEGERTDEDDIKALFYHIELVQLLGGSFDRKQICNTCWILVALQWLMMILSEKCSLRTRLLSYWSYCPMVVVVLPDPFRGMGAWRNSTETQQSGHSPRFGPEVKYGWSGVEDGAPERLGCGSVKEEVSQILQRVFAGAACTNVSQPQRDGAVPAPLSERWAEMARQLPREARPSGRPPIVYCPMVDSNRFLSENDGGGIEKVGMRR